VDKLCGELQTLARLCGYEQFDLRSWFYADSITINGGTPRAKEVIVGRGTSVVGETKCREVIDLVAR
jgi:hypothetical protein